ncbi:MAG TPA: GspH/FimT family pseudopilin [Sphingomicrobium sp.]|nr:GspH/FimT family pseudopilin [Sphingomicrobium sp.]
MPRNGFTLVELIVVIAVMALLTGAVVLTVASPGGASDSATRFASRLAAARDEAVLSGRPVSAWVSPSGYGFDQLRGGRWQRMAERPFEGADWDKGTAVRTATGTGEGRMRVRFDSLGLPDQPVALRIERDGRAAGVRVAANGDVTVE